MFPRHHVFLPGKDQFNHAGKVGLEFSLILSVLPWSISAGALDFSEVTKVSGAGNQHVVHKDCRISFHSVPVGQLGSTRSFR